MFASAREHDDKKKTAPTFKSWKSNRENDVFAGARALLHIKKKKEEIIIVRRLDHSCNLKCRFFFYLTTFRIAE